jgi:methylenetetrahydrofolate--tRNA-(uracil-5-)-methyltransferase
MLAQRLFVGEVVPPPPTTALGGLLMHLSRGAAVSDPKNYQPSNVTWAWLPPLVDRRMRKRARYEAMAQRALAELAVWVDEAPLARATISPLRSRDVYGIWSAPP